MVDDILKEFINESLEHLGTIEEELLSMEESGDDVDEEVVNKIFRAAHSIKGGSSFFGLNKVKELAHRAETILDMIRSREMMPNAEVINILLAAFDKLREMLNQPDASGQTDTDDLMSKLDAVVSSSRSAIQSEPEEEWPPPPPPQAQAAPVQAPVQAPPVQVTPVQAASAKAAAALAKVAATPAKEPVKPPPPSPVCAMPTEAEIDRARRYGQYIYQIKCDLVADIERKGKTIKSVFDDLSYTGEVLDCAVDTASIGTLDDAVYDSIPINVMFATIQEPDIVRVLFDTLSADNIQTLFDLSKEAAPAIEQPAPPANEPKPPEPAQEAQKAKPAQEKTASEEKASSKSSSQTAETLRVNVGLIENLANLAGELVLSRNQLRAAVSQKNTKLLSEADQRINQISSELQDVIMQTRLQPIGNVFSRFPRVVRDLSQAMGKEIQLDILGKEIAVDKSVHEGLAELLTHMVRNSVDHGIETLEGRRLAGKKPSGLIRIEARHEAGKVVVDVADDGKGIDPERVSEVAINKGLITAEKVKKLTDAEKQALIFAPGLSTTREVSDVSGRGVGMDVVKTNLDQLGGQVEIHSEVGKGTLFRIKLPLTLAVMPSLIVTASKEQFAIPQANIEELLRLRPEEVKERIEVVGDSEVLLLRNKILPLTRLSDILGIAPTYTDEETGELKEDRRDRLHDRRSRRSAVADATDPKSKYSKKETTRSGKDRRQSAGSAIEIIVATTGTMSYGLVVDEFHDTEEVVVKPLGLRLRDLREYSGSTILGDGTVALILDMAGLAVKAGLSSVSDSVRAVELAAEVETKRLQDSKALLLFYNGPDNPMAIPMGMVQRVESVLPGQIEHFGARRTLKYRNGFLPLYTVSDAANVQQLDEGMSLIVLVCNVDGEEIGLLGSMPVDAIRTQADIDGITHNQTGIAGSLIIQNRTTLLVDLYDLLEAARPGGRENGNSAHASGVVLLAEDSEFFRNQIRKFLETDGHRVITAVDGEEAWDLLLKNLSEIQVLVTDIEMPKLGGLGLTARIRADERTAKLPIVAVTSLGTEQDVARGLAAGVNEYQTKLDRGKLSGCVRGIIGAYT
ncbi:MAG: hybrid sensor histidine kinase/response regulator [Syntrophorhabdaceae bacterium]|nr:hybrid sensor histidine kinase/response regulator [Syntrophorhabdaceae bacterium]